MPRSRLDAFIEKALSDDKEKSAYRDVWTRGARWKAHAFMI